MKGMSGELFHYSGLRVHQSLIAPHDMSVDTGGELSRMARKARFIMATSTGGCGFHEFATSVSVRFRPSGRGDKLRYRDAAGGATFPAPTGVTHTISMTQGDCR